MFDYFRRLFRTEHRYVRENLSAYLDKRTSAREKARVERHLQECSECRADLRTLQQTVNLLHLVSEVPLPRSFLIPASEGRSQPVRRYSPAFVMLRNASAIATFLLVIVFSGNILLRMGFEVLPGAMPKQVGPEEARPLVVSTQVVEKVAIQETPAMRAMGTPEQAVEKEEAMVAESVPPATSFAGGRATEAAAAAERAPAPALEKPAILGEKQLVMGKSLSDTITETLTVSVEVAVTPTPVEKPPAATPTAVPPTNTPLVEAVQRAPAEAAQQPTEVARLQRPLPQATVPSGRIEFQEMLRTTLNGALWVLLLTTVVLWAVTAAVRLRRR